MSNRAFVNNKFFSPGEFDSPDKKGSGANMNEEFIEKLTLARFKSNTPYIINSGYRTKEHNKKVGGVVNSSHCKGLAVDIKCTNSVQRYRILYGLIQAGFKRIGISKKFIHVDHDKSKPQLVTWLYK